MVTLHKNRSPAVNELFRIGLTNVYYKLILGNFLSDIDLYLTKVESCISFVLI